MAAPRTIRLPASPALASFRLVWPVKDPGDRATYGLDASGALAATGDSFLSVAVCAEPSGTGELAVEAVSVSGGVVSATLSGGQPGRTYSLRVTALTVAGSSLEWFAALPVAAPTGSPAAQTAPSAAFGPPATWSLSAPLAFSLARPLSLSLAAAL